MGSVRQAPRLQLQQQTSVLQYREALAAQIRLRDAMKFPPSGLRYGDLRDQELTRRDEARCARFWNFVRCGLAHLKGDGDSAAN
jgi:hypothetical protein